MVTAAICLLIPPFNGCSVSLAHVVVTHGPLLYAYSETRCSFFVHHFAKLSHNVSILVYTCSLLGATCTLKSLVSTVPPETIYPLACGETSSLPRGCAANSPRYRGKLNLVLDEHDRTPR